MRSDFEAAGARLTVVSGTEEGADEFLEAAWKGGELFIDDEEVVKRSLGGHGFKNYWLLRPSVLRHLGSYARRFGAGTSDITHEKTQMLGGTLVINTEGKVVHEFHETSTFYQGSAADLLKAVQGLSPTPLQQEVCEPAAP